MPRFRGQWPPFFYYPSFSVISVHLVHSRNLLLNLHSPFPFAHSISYLSLTFFMFPCLDQKLRSGTRLSKYVINYGNRANDWQVASQCTPFPIHAAFLILTFVPPPSFPFLGFVFPFAMHVYMSQTF